MPAIISFDLASSHFGSVYPFKTSLLVHGRGGGGSTRLREGFSCFAKGSGGPENGSENNKEEKQAVDWDKAWSSYKQKKKKKSLFSMLDMEKYVTRSPESRDFPLSEEVDPLKRTERSTLGVWTDPKFTLAGFGVIIGLFIYMVVIVGAPPSK